MSLTEKTTHGAEARRNLVAQFRSKLKLEGWVSSYVEQVQELEAVLFDLLENTRLGTAADAQLDVIGAIVGEARQGTTDPTYRVNIAARIAINLSNGTIENIIGIASALTGGSPVEVTEFYPAAFFATIVNPIDPAVIDPVRLATLVKTAKPAGVFAVVTLAVTPAFTFDIGPGYDQGKYGGAF